MQLQKIQSKIFLIRGFNVLLDYDLAELYNVETRVLNQSVKRNSERFPEDFMFQLTKEEFTSLISQNVISKNTSRGGNQKLPHAFTEQGLAMLSGVLHSPKAIAVNIAIMRAFVFMRQFALTHDELTRKLKELENKYNKQFKDVYDAINYLLKKDAEEVAHRERKRIGFKRKNENE